jgi:uncharacterized membrane protein YhaH (DUF805 family)
VGEFIVLVVFFTGALIGNQTAIGQTTSASLIWIILYLPKHSLAAKRSQDRNKPRKTALDGYIPSVIALAGSDSLLQSFALAAKRFAYRRRDDPDPSSAAHILVNDQPRSSTYGRFIRPNAD